MNATYTSLSLYGLLCIASVVALSAFGPAGTTAPPAALMPGPDVKASQLNCGVVEFGDHVLWLSNPDTVPVTNKSYRFTVGSFKALTDTLTCPRGQQAGLMILFGGNDRDNSIRFAYQMACMDLAWSHEVEEGPYTVDSAIFETNAAGELIPLSVDWQAGPGKTFQERILVDRYDDNVFTRVYSGVDAHSIFKISTINDLIAHNDLGPNDLIEVVPIAEPLAWVSPDRGGDFTIRTCLVAVDQSTGQRLINDSATTKPRFKNRGCDLGTGCPPSCGIATFTLTGVALRKGC